MEAVKVGLFVEATCELKPKVRRELEFKRSQERISCEEGQPSAKALRLGGGRKWPPGSPLHFQKLEERHS